MCNGACGNNAAGSCCGGHKMMGRWGYKLVCVLLALVVAGIIFCTGFKLGMVGSRFGGWDMHRGDMMYYRGGMMQGGVRMMVVPDTTTTVR